jgi:hypothetical protein
MDSEIRCPRSPANTLTSVEKRHRRGRGSMPGRFVAMGSPRGLGFHEGIARALSNSCDAEALRVPAEMVLDKCGNEEVGMIVAFVPT